MKSKLLFGALAVALPLVASADGDVIFDLDVDSTETGFGLAEGSGGQLYFTANSNSRYPAIAGTQYSLVAVDSTGQRLAGFGTNGRALNSEELWVVAARPDGTVIAGRNSLTSFNAAGARLNLLSQCFGCVNSLMLLPDGRAYFGGTRYTTPRFQQLNWAIGRIETSGLLDPAYGAGTIDGSPSKSITTMRRLPDGRFVVYGNSEASITANSLGRFNADGTLDFTFGTNGVLALTAPDRLKYGVRADLAIDHSQRMLVPGDANVLSRLNSNGTHDNSYATVPMVAGTTYTGFVLDSQDRAIVFGTRNDQAYVARLLPNGGFDVSFGTGGEALLSPNVPDLDSTEVEFGIVDSADRPTLLLRVVRAHGGGDVALMRLTSGGLLDSTFGAGVVDDDPYADAFTIASKTAPPGSSTVVSDPIVATGFNVPTLADFTTALGTNAGISVGCGSDFVTTPNMLQPGWSLCVRLAAPTTPGATNTTTVTIGGRQATYSVTASGAAADITPDPFTFTNQANLEPGTVATSAPVTIQGIQGFAPVAISGGTYSIGCQGPYISSNSLITIGQTVCLRVTAPANYDASTSATLAINGVTGRFTATTRSVATTPNAFTFLDQTNVAAGANVVSNGVYILGIEAPVPISITGGTYSIGCQGPYVSTNGTVTNGQSVCLLVQSPANYGSSTTAILDVNGVTGSFTVSTAPPDTTPDAFSFTSRSDLAQGAVAQSTAITISGTNSPAPVSIAGGEYSLGCNGTFTSAAGTIAPAQTVCVRNTVGASTTTTTLTIGGVNGTFSSTPVVSTSFTTRRSSGGGALGAEIALLGLLGVLRASRIRVRKPTYLSSSGTR